MHKSGNTVLITGGATGIGLELARVLVSRGNTVAICGRRRERLEEAQRAIPELRIRVCDVAEETSRLGLLGWVEAELPQTNVLINNAGIQHRIDLRDVEDVNKADEEIAINVLAPIRLTAMFLPLLLRNAEPAIVNVSSGLGFAPLARMPVYCATKAALHSLTLSLRWQLRDTAVKVFEIIPPVVTSELGAYHRPPALNRAAMPTDVAATQIADALARDELEFALGEAANLRAKREEIFEVMNSR